MVPSLTFIFSFGIHAHYDIVFSSSDFSSPFCGHRTNRLPEVAALDDSMVHSELRMDLALYVQ